MELRDLPSVDALTGALAGEYSLPGALLTSMAREAIDEARAAIEAGEPADPAAIASRRAARMVAATPIRVINATGVLLHTNLGRAPLHQDAVAAAALQSATYGNLEIDLASGERGKRGDQARTLLATVAGAEAAMVTGNNAGALLLSLAALADPGGRVAVSRGELIEIGGSFRLPDLMAASGARLIEVGTTNRTRLADYERVSGSIDLILKVHPSNYRVEGFAEEASWVELGELAARRSIPFVADVGSGLIDTRVPWLDGGPPGWLEGEPGVRQTLAAGADVVIFSGDKLVGGPQGGLAVGGADPIARMASHPIARATRMDGPSLAALTATLRLYADNRGAEIPFWHMASRSEAELRSRCEAVLAGADKAGRIVVGTSLPGAGSVPGKGIPTPIIEFEGDADRLWASLAAHDPPLVAGRRDGKLTINLRAVDPSEDELVAAAISSAKA